MGETYRPRRYTRGGELMTSYQEQDAVAQRASADNARRQIVAQIRARRIELIKARRASPFSLPEIRDDMSDADLATAQGRIERMGAGVPSQIPGYQPPMDQSPGRTNWGQVMQRSPETAAVGRGPLEQTINPEFVSETGADMALAAMVPGVAGAGMAATALNQANDAFKQAGEVQRAEQIAATPRTALEQAIEQHQPNLAGADVRETPAGPVAIMDSQSGPRAVGYEPSGTMRMQAGMGDAYMRSTPAERAVALTRAMPTAPDNSGGNVAVPQTIYSDELGRTKTALDGVTGMTNMGQGTLNADGKVSFTTGGVESDKMGGVRSVTPVQGGKITVRADGVAGKEQLAPGPYQTPGAPLPSSTFSEEDKARHAAAVARYNAAQQAPVAQDPAVAKTNRGALNEITENFINEVRPGSSKPAAPKHSIPAPPQVEAEIAAEDARLKQAVPPNPVMPAGKVDLDSVPRINLPPLSAKDKAAMDAAIERENAEIQRLIKPGSLPGRIKGSTPRVNTPRVQIPAQGAPGRVVEGVPPVPMPVKSASNGADNRGTGNRRQMTTPLGITETNNDVVDSFARNPEEDQFKKKLEFSGYGSYA